MKSSASIRAIIGLFFEILSAPVGVTHELRRMNLYGVLSRYIVRRIGRNARNTDLLCVRTPQTTHTLFVSANLRRFALPKYDRRSSWPCRA